MTSAAARPRLAATNSAQERQATRLDIELDVDFSSEHNFYNGFSENISSGGIFIATHFPAPLGHRIPLKFRLPDSNEYIDVEGEVRWVRVDNPETPDFPPGMGVRFMRIDPSDVQRIEEFVREREPMFYDDE